MIRIMNKKILKILLIVLSLIYITIESVLAGGLFEKMLDSGFEPEENILFILSLILLIVGLFIKTNNEKSIDNIEKYKIRLKIFRILGFIPFFGSNNSFNNFYIRRC